jgi:hypothetical protein
MELPPSTIINIGYEDMPGKDTVAGFFSFTLYTESSKNVTKIGKLDSGDNTGIKHAKLYYYGLIAYLEMVRKSKWSGWRVLIHTDELTLQRNPKSFSIFRELGAIIGISTLLDKYTDSEKYRGIFRINRYAPLFFKGFDRPVCIRDADTIFDKYLGKLLYLDTDVFKVKFREFINYLSNWEHAFINIVNKYENKIIFSYDDHYALKPEHITNNIIPELLDYKWTGPVKNNPIYKAVRNRTKKIKNIRYNNIKNINRSSLKMARFLAGNLTKIGNPLPPELWEPGLSRFLETYKGMTIHADEAYLTRVIYTWCRNHGSAEFFKLNYVSPNVITGLFNHYLSIKYPGLLKYVNMTNTTENYIERNTLPEIVEFTGNGTPPPGMAPPRKLKRGLIFNEAKMNEISPENKSIYNSFYGKDVTIPHISESLRSIAEEFKLKHPEESLHPDYFYNPLRNNFAKRPGSLPEYLFGGGGKSRKRRSK